MTLDSSHKDLSVSKLFQKSWAQFSADPMNHIAMMAIVACIGMAATFIPYVGTVLSMPVYIGCVRYLYLRSKGYNPSFEVLFFAFKNLNLLGHILVAYFLNALFIAIGTILLIVPGIYILVAYSMTNQIFAVRHDLDFWAVLELSRKTVSKRWWAVAWVMLCCGLLAGLGLAILFIGVLVTGPVGGYMFVYLYRELFEDEVTSEAPTSEGLPSPTL